MANATACYLQALWPIVIRSMNRQSLIIILVLLISSNTFSQKLLYDIGDYRIINPISEDYIEVYYDLNNCPNSLIDKVESYLEKELGEHLMNFRFASWRELDIDKYFSDNPKEKNKYLIPVPKYSFNYTWSDTTLGIKKASIFINLDHIGQVTYMSFPRGLNIDTVKLLCLDEAFQKADSIINADKLGYKCTEYHLAYDYKKNDLAWIFNFELKTGNNAIEKDMQVFLIEKSCKEVPQQIPLGELIIEDYFEEEIIIKQ